MIIRLAEGLLETRFGRFLEVLYYDGQKECMALVMGNVENGEDVLCRVHSSCISAHIFNSVECDCREQMEMSQFLIEQAGRGIVIWLDQEGRGNGHLALLSSVRLKNLGINPTQAYIDLGYESDAWGYKRAAEVLIDLKVKSIILLTNNPDKKMDLEKENIVISDKKKIAIDPAGNEVLLATYQDKVRRGHLIDLDKD
jgi:GTP cyclohydrolase II